MTLPAGVLAALANDDVSSFVCLRARPSGGERASREERLPRAQRGPRAAPSGLPALGLARPRAVASGGLLSVVLAARDASASASAELEGAGFDGPPRFAFRPDVVSASRTSGLVLNFRALARLQAKTRSATGNRGPLPRALPTPRRSQPWPQAQQTTPIGGNSSRAREPKGPGVQRGRPWAPFGPAAGVLRAKRVLRPKKGVLRPNGVLRAKRDRRAQRDPDRARSAKNSRRLQGKEIKSRGRP